MEKVWQSFVAMFCGSIVIQFGIVWSQTVSLRIKYFIHGCRRSSTLHGVIRCV